MRSNVKTTGWANKVDIHKVLEYETPTAPKQHIESRKENYNSFLEVSMNQLSVM